MYARLRAPSRREQYCLSQQQELLCGNIGEPAPSLSGLQWRSRSRVATYTRHVTAFAGGEGMEYAAAQPHSLSSSPCRALPPPSLGDLTMRRNHPRHLSSSPYTSTSSSSTTLVSSERPLPSETAAKGTASLPASRPHLEYATARPPPVSR